jgi:hydroxyacylglutathione hydrolase
MKRFLWALGISFIALVGTAAALFFILFGKNQLYFQGPALDPAGVTRVEGFAGVYIVPTGPMAVALIDAGNDATGSDILRALAAMNLSAENVRAIFITHAHPDHCAAVSMFPSAKVFALKAEVDLAAGKAEYRSPISTLSGKKVPTPFSVSHPLEPGETVKVDEVDFTVFALPGHTPGSAAYLARGVLFSGDAIGLSKRQKGIPPIWLFSNNVDEAKASLRALAQTLSQRNDIRFLATSHMGTAAGITALSDI